MASTLPTASSPIVHRSSPKRHEKLYFADGNAILTVDGTLFNLHKSILSNDPDSVFKSMFASPQGQSVPSQGLTDEDPIVVPDLSADAFEILVQMIYAVAVDGTANSLKRPVPPSQLVTAFKLADRFSLDSVIAEVGRTILSRPLQDTSSAQFLHLGIRFKDVFRPENRQRWYLHLVGKREPLTEEEGELLGGRVTARIGQQREYAFVDYLLRLPGRNWGTSLERPALIELGEGWVDNGVEDLL